MELMFLSQLSSSEAALVGAAIGLGLAIIGGLIMLYLLRFDFVRNSAVPQQIFSKVSPPVFYFGMVAPVWTFVGAAIGYQLGGATP